MSLNISSYNNATGNIASSKVNTQSKQYKAMEEKGWISGIIQNESMMSPEEKMIYETFGGRDTLIKNLMKPFDSDGDLLNANGVAGMDVTGKGTSRAQVSRETKLKTGREYLHRPFLLGRITTGRNKAIQRALC